MSSEQYEADRRAVHAVAEQMEAVAEALERLMARTREARSALVDLGPGATRHSGFEGSHEQLESSALTGYGFDRVEAARRRIAIAVHDPLDAFDLEV